MNPEKLASLNRKTPEQAYKAGYDQGLNGASLLNSCFTFFVTQALSEEWERGSADGKIEYDKKQQGLIAK